MKLDDAPLTDRSSYAASARSTHDAMSAPRTRRQTIEQRLTPTMTWLTGGWLVLLTWWVSSNFVRLRVAANLIELEETDLGVAITDDDHLSDFPSLQAKFEALGVGGQSDMSWTLALTAFAFVGLLIAAGVAFSSRRRSLLSVMAAAWGGSVALAAANSETLTLLGWLTN